MRRAARTLLATHRAAYALSLVGILDAAITLLLSEVGVSRLGELSGDEWRRAIDSPLVLTAAGLIAIIITIPLRMLKSARIASSPAFLEVLCAAVLSLPPAAASYSLATTPLSTACLACE